MIARLRKRWRDPVSYGLDMLLLLAIAVGGGAATALWKILSV